MSINALPQLLASLKVLINSPIKKGALIACITGIGYLLKIQFERRKSDINDPKHKNQLTKEKRKANVDFAFLKKLIKLIKIAIPRLLGKEMLSLFVLSLLLVVRTYLSIYISEVNGSIVKAIVKIDFEKFVKQV